MSKITNCFLMLELLNSGRVYSVNELSKELGVTERMVRYYKEQLELSGYPIESFKGPGGGYFINKNSSININFFNKYDLEVLDRVKEELTNMCNADLEKKYNLLNRKLHSIYNINKVISEYKTLNLTVHENDEKLKVLNDCIKNKKRIIISYLGANGEITKREIIPISVFQFENITYVTAFCKLRGAIRHFSLSEIVDYNIR
ncbi:MAG TPA: WYL domain-containing protein [Candidatus Coprosoma intestinipullorum]|uniref:WYL domain-containing protein n=1 Tax=Candidatus Coprosoma intestinipullorum TaxID=2840752 RepID=A0A9D1CYR5_9FIRM|nr:WYL domain-containing protein [Candidatus Coprosoma intestinipullorum]